MDSRIKKRPYSPNRKTDSNLQFVAKAKVFAKKMSPSSVPGYLILCAAVSILITSWAITLGPIYGLVAGLAPFTLTVLITQPGMRIAVLVGGGLFLFGSSSTVGPAKLIYATLLFICGGVACARLVRHPPPWFGPFRPLGPIGLALVICMFAGTLNSSSEDLTLIARQSIFYLIVPLGPLIGMDAGRDLRSKVIMRWIAITGMIAAVGFATDWMNRRGVSNLSVGRFVLSSLVLPTLAFALSLVRVAYARGIARFFWAVPLVVIPVAMFVTGTRTNLIILLAVAGVLGSHTKFRVSNVRALGIGIAWTALAFSSISWLNSYLFTRSGFLDSRVSALMLVLRGEGQSDASFVGRSEQYRFALHLIRDSPFFGQGPGYVSPMSLDTPLVTVVRFGVVGTFILLLFLFLAYRGIARTGATVGYSYMHSAAAGTAVVVVSSIPFGSPIEDRGFGFMLILLFLGISSCLQECHEPANRLMHFHDEWQGL